MNEPIQARMALVEFRGGPLDGERQFLSLSPKYKVPIIERKWATLCDHAEPKPDLNVQCQCHVYRLCFRAGRFFYVLEGIDC